MGVALEIGRRPRRHAGCEKARLRNTFRDRTSRPRIITAGQARTKTTFLEIRVCLCDVTIRLICLHFAIVVVDGHGRVSESSIGRGDAGSSEEQWGRCRLRQIKPPPERCLGSIDRCHGRLTRTQLDVKRRRQHIRLGFDRKRALSDAEHDDTLAGQPLGGRRYIGETRAPGVSQSQ